MTDWTEEQLDQVTIPPPSLALPPPTHHMQLIAGHKEVVFARTSPKQKLFIVEGYQVERSQCFLY